MALLCNDCEVKGKNHQIWCKHTKAPCACMRYCGVTMKYFQTDAAANCKVRTKNGKQKHKTDQVDSI